MYIMDRKQSLPVCRQALFRAGGINLQNHKIVSVNIQAYQKHGNTGRGCP